MHCANEKFLCENGGICSNMTVPQSSLFGFYCSCPPGYSGDLCEISKLIFFWNDIYYVKCCCIMNDKYPFYKTKIKKIFFLKLKQRKKKKKNFDKKKL